MSNQSFTINPGITKIDHPSAYALIQSGQCLLIDVREKDEYDSGFIPTAVNLSVNNITKETASAIAPDKAKPIIVYCRSGIRQSAARGQRRQCNSRCSLCSRRKSRLRSAGQRVPWRENLGFPQETPQRLQETERSSSGLDQCSGKRHRFGLIHRLFNP